MVLVNNTYHLNFQVQEIIQTALDALPESEDCLDSKSEIVKCFEDLKNGDSCSSEKKVGCCAIDMALCQIADEAFLSPD